MCIRDRPSTSRSSRRCSPACSSAWAPSTSCDSPRRSPRSSRQSSSTRSSSSGSSPWPCAGCGTNPPRRPRCCAATCSSTAPAASSARSSVSSSSTCWCPRSPASTRNGRQTHHGKPTHPGPAPVWRRAANTPPAHRHPGPGLPAGHDRLRPGRLRQQRQRLPGATRRQDRRLPPHRAVVHPTRPERRPASQGRQGQPRPRGGSEVLPEPSLGGRGRIRPDVQRRFQPGPGEQGPDRLHQGASGHRRRTRRRQPGAGRPGCLAGQRVWPRPPHQPRLRRRADRTRRPGTGPERGTGSGIGHREHPGTHARIPRRATRQRPQPQPRAGCNGPLSGRLAVTVGDVMGRGKLRIYLGAAPGVGKTYAMLEEGRRRAERGTDVVVGLAETHGRQHTAELLEGMEIIPRREISYRGTTFTEMDLDAVLARRPAVALVDELAHTNVPGSRNEKRWQDIELLLASGIDVISTVNIQHLESLNDVVEKITGVPQRERVPDAVVRAADQVEVVDMAPEALRRRMAHGNVYAAEKMDAALRNYFRIGNLTALRELALLWTADKVDEALQLYRDEHDIEETWETRERVVVALTGGPEGETLIRRAARVAARTAGGDLLAVHVTRSDGLTGASPANLAAQRKLVETLGGTYHQIVGDNIADALLEFAHAENATQLVLGGSRRSRLTAMLTGPGIGADIIRASGDIDVHLVTHAQMGKGCGLPRPHGSLTLRRRLQGYGLALLLPPLLTLLLASQRQQQREPIALQ